MRDLRSTLARAIERIECSDAQGFAQFLCTHDGEALPCWRRIVSHFAETFDQDQQLEVWRVLLDVGDPRPLMLFIHLHQDDGAMLRHLLPDARRLPVFLQRYLAAFDAIRGNAKLDGSSVWFDPEAQQIFEAGEKIRTRERERFDIKVHRLMRAVLSPSHAMGMNSP